MRHCKQQEAQSWSLMQSDPQHWTQQWLLMHTSPLSRCLILVSCTTHILLHSRLPKCTTAPVLGPSYVFSTSKCNSLWDSQSAQSKQRSKQISHYDCSVWSHKGASLTLTSLLNLASTTLSCNFMVWLISLCFFKSVGFKSSSHHPCSWNFLPAHFLSIPQASSHSPGLWKDLISVCLMKNLKNIDTASWHSELIWKVRLIWNIPLKSHQLW